MEQADKIEKAIEELVRRENAFSEAAKEYAEAEGDYRQAKASAYLLAEGSIPERESRATIKAWPEHKRKLAAEATLAIMKAKLDDCKQVISARQSILSAESKVHYATKNLTA